MLVKLFQVGFEAGIMGPHQEFHFRISDRSVQFCEEFCGGSVGDILDPCLQNEFIHYLGKVN